jgi:formate dehydrogenase subunit gamma
MANMIGRALSAVALTAALGVAGPVLASAPDAKASVQTAPVLVAQAAPVLLAQAATPDATRRASSDVWRDINAGREFYTALPNNEGGRLIQRSGETWRQARNGPVTEIGGWALVAMVLVVAAFFAWRGTMKLHGPPSGRLIERFTLFERTAHWTMAISFVLLAITGLLLLFGKHVLLPVFGHAAMGWIGVVAKNVHNYIGPLFGIAIVIGFFTFLRDNYPKAYDAVWLKKGGGLFNDAHVPSHRFNAGEKVWFWGGLFFLGIIVTASGLVLDFPNFGQTRSTMQIAWVLHAVGGLLFMLGAIGHIYMGTVGVEGAYKAMRTGYVDETWAREHHEYWYDDIKAGKIAAQRTEAQAPPVGRTAAT